MEDNKTNGTGSIFNNDNTNDSTEVKELDTSENEKCDSDTVSNKGLDSAKNKKGDRQLENEIKEISKNIS